MLNSISPLLSSHPPSSAPQPSSNFRPLHVGALVHYNTVIILTPRTTTFLLSPASLGILITFHRILLLNCLVMKIGATLVTHTVSFLLPLPVPVTQNSLLFPFGVLRTLLTLLLTTPSPFAILLTRHSRWTYLPLRSGYFRLRQNLFVLPFAHFSYFRSFFFFPALPDKCETWSVNNWNKHVIEIKFPQRKKPTTNPPKNNKTSNTHTQAKARARQICQGNLQTK